MKTVAKLLNKKYKKTLLDYKEYRKKQHEIQALLKEYQIPCELKTDVDCFRYEMIYSSLLTKRKFEDVFFDTYVVMYDYWYDLTYQERKKQMNLEIDRFRDTLPYFMSGEQEIYMPCFDVSFNHLYTDEIVLLDLKQYHVFIRTCAKEVKTHTYHAEAYQYGFTTCEVMAKDKEDYVLYHPLSNRLYLYCGDTYTSCLSFHPKQKEMDHESLGNVAKAMLEKDDEAVLDILLESNLVNDKIKKKLIKIKQKMNKNKGK